MGAKFSFLFVNIWFDLAKCEFIVENSSFKILVLLSPIFVADTKINFLYNFLAPLRELISEKHNTIQEHDNGILNLMEKEDDFEKEKDLRTNFAIFFKKLLFSINKCLQKNST